MRTKSFRVFFRHFPYFLFLLQKVRLSPTSTGLSIRRVFRQNPEAKSMTGISVDRSVDIDMQEVGADVDSDGLWFDKIYF